MIEKLIEDICQAKQVGVTLPGYRETIIKINEIIDVVNALEQEPKTECTHNWAPTIGQGGKQIGSRCINCGAIMC